MIKTKQEIIEQNICKYFEDDYVQEVKLTSINTTDTGFYVEGNTLVKIGVDNYDNGWIAVILNKDLSVKEIVDEGVC